MRKRDNIVELTKVEDSEEGLVRHFKWNDKDYYVVNTQPFVDDSRTLLVGIITQASNDYVKLHPGTQLTKEDDKLIYETAKKLLFDDDYLIDYGGIDIGIREIMFFITGEDPNMDMFRAGILEKLKKYQNKKK